MLESLKTVEIEKNAFPLVSVILAVYQGEEYILRAARSVLNQTYENLELIVIDDGSTDKTLQNLALINDARLKVVRQKNKGTAVARNLGVIQSKGEYIAFIDADDLWFPHKVTREIQTIQKYNQPICMVYSWYYAVDEADLLINFSPPYRVMGNIFQTVLERESVLLPSTTLMHRSIFEKVGGFPKEVFYLEDRSFYLKACKNFPAFPTEERLIIYRQSLSGKCRRILKNFEVAVQENHHIVNSLQNTLTPKELEQLSLYETRNLFYRFLMYGYYQSAQKLFQTLDIKLLRKDKKGLIAILSMKIGLNLLNPLRQFVQAIMKCVLKTWWQNKLNQVNINN